MYDFFFFFKEIYVRWRGVFKMIEFFFFWIVKWLKWNKVSFEISLEKNSTNFSYIFILSVNFKNLIVKLYVFIIFFIFAKFQKDQKLIALLSNKC